MSTDLTPAAAAIATMVTGFWRSVDIGQPDECWPWTGYVEKGYGQFFFAGRMRGAHELAVTFSTGEIRLASLDTCHSCNNSVCCNPGHLRFDTRQSNVDDMVRAGRAHKAYRLCDEDVRLIRCRREAGAAQDDLAAQYGVSSSYISMIVNGLARPDAGGPIATVRYYHRKKSA